MNKKTLYTSLAALALLSFQAKGFADENTSTSSWVAAQLSGGFPIYADRVILTEVTTGEVLYDGSTDGMSGWSDLLTRLGLSTDLHVGGQGFPVIDGQQVHVGSVELPKSESTLSSSSWIAGVTSGGNVYADRVILTEATTGEVLYDGSTDGMSDWSDLLARLGLPTDLHVGGRGFSMIDGQLVEGGSVELPKTEEAEVPGSWTINGGMLVNRVVLTNATTGEVLYDGSTDGMSDWSDLLARLGLPTDLHVGGRGVNIIDNQLVYFGSIELPKASDTKNVTTGEETETTSSAKESEVKQNRTEKTSAEQEVKSEKALLPSTGEVMSALGVIGAGLSSLGLIGLKRRRK